VGSADTVQLNRAHISELVLFALVMFVFLLVYEAVAVAGG
jgi:hypothetical protein